MRLIDADALKKAIDKEFEKADLSDYEACSCVCDIYDKCIDNAPTIVINDKSLEIAQKSFKLGRKLGSLEEKIENEKTTGKMSEDDKKSLNALKDDFKERYKRAEDWIEKASDEEIRIRAEATRDFIAEVILTIDKYMRGDK